MRKKTHLKGMKSAERRMKLLLMLQSKKKNITPDYLAEYFDVSRRTIFRDMRVLQEMNVPVSHEQHEGYLIPKGYSIPPLMFTSKQMATIMMGLSFVKSQVDKDMVEDARDVELKIRNVVPGELKDLMSALDDHTVVNPFSVNVPEKKQGGNWFLIANAIAYRQVIRFAYKDEVRDMDPYQLVYFTDHWNVMGYCHLRKEIRNFVLDRMSEVSLTTANFSMPKLEKEELVFRLDKKPHHIELDVDANVVPPLLQKLPARVIDMNPGKTSTRLRFEFDNLTFLNEFLLQFGNKITILAPNQLILMREVLLNEMMTQIQSKHQ
jgi:predicted DNA-binding transcriptional regulator YafY